MPPRKRKAAELDDGSGDSDDIDLVLASSSEESSGDDGDADLAIPEADTKMEMVKDILSRDRHVYVQNTICMPPRVIQSACVCAGPEARFRRRLRVL